MVRERAGATLVETVVALVCGALVVQLGLQAMAAVRAAGADMRERSDGLATVRVARVALRSELQAGVAGRDWTAFPPDSVRARAFRGEAGVCPAPAGSTELLVRWRGSRRPEPDKDSLLVLDDGGGWTAVDLVAVGAATVACPRAPAVPVERWEIAAAPGRPIVLARLFETTSYHVADRALRLRQGSGGRQPLTPETVSMRGSGFTADDGALGIRLRSARTRSRAWSAYLSALR